MQLVIPIFGSTMFVLVASEDCDAICNAVVGCDRGSYCKYWSTPQTCFGLYHDGDTGYCYQPNNSSCPTDNPVICDPVSTTDPTTNYSYSDITTSLSNGSTVPEVRHEVQTCQSICDSVLACANCPHAHGSYCKSDKNPQVCFGLYHTSEGSICFEPNDPTCNESVPVLCPTDT